MTARSLPPGPRLPRSAQTLLTFASTDRFLARCARRYGSIFTVRAFPWGTTVMLADPDAIREVFTGDPDLWQAGVANAPLAPLFGDNSLMVVDGTRHLATRKLLLPAFHGHMVARYERLASAVTSAEVAQWPVGRPFKLISRMQAITLEVMLQAVVGADASPQRDRLRRVLTEAVRLRSIILLMWAWPALTRVGPWRRFMGRLEEARALLRKEIELRRADPRSAARLDVLSSLVTAEAFTDETLLDQLTTLLLAAHETTATALTWALERLVRHPALIQRVREDRDYLDAVVKEVLRLRPVLPAVPRRAASSANLAGYQVPAGTTVMPCVRLLHLRNDLYPDPERFMPERFLEGQGQGYAWIPFGGGTRRCIGAAFACSQMRVVISTVLAQTTLAPDRSADEAIHRHFISLAPARGGRVLRVS